MKALNSRFPIYNSTQFSTHYINWIIIIIMQTKTLNLLVMQVMTYNLLEYKRKEQSSRYINLIVSYRENILYAEPYYETYDMFLGTWELKRQRTCSTWSRRFRKFSLRYVSTLVMIPSSLILSFSNCLLSCGWIASSTHKIQTVTPVRSLPLAD